MKVNIFFFVKTFEYNRKCKKSGDIFESNYLDMLHLRLCMPRDGVRSKEAWPYVVSDESTRNNYIFDRSQFLLVFPGNLNIFPDNTFSKITIQLRCGMNLQPGLNNSSLYIALTTALFSIIKKHIE